MYDSFDPDISITPAKGKYYDPNQTAIEELLASDDILEYSEVLEDLALLSYDGKQSPAKIKGVQESFLSMSNLDSIMVDGKAELQRGGADMAIVGYGIAHNLSLYVGRSIDPINMYAPKKTNSVNIDPSKAFKIQPITPSGIFMINPDFDGKYIIVPIEFSRKLFDHEKMVSALEIKLKNKVSLDDFASMAKEKLGDNFVVRTQFQLNEIIYKTNQTEKWITVLILGFILLIAAFNIVGSLTMLIIDKKEDTKILSALGASDKSIFRIFLYEGLMINFIGVMIGVILGVALCLIQQHYGLVRLEGGIVEFYPVRMQWLDFVAIFTMVFVIGLIASYFPIRILISKSNLTSTSVTS